MEETPPPPPGFEIDRPAPPAAPPPGFVLDSAVPSPPPGFLVDRGGASVFAGGTGSPALAEQTAGLVPGPALPPPVAPPPSPTPRLGRIMSPAPGPIFAPPPTSAGSPALAEQIANRDAAAATKLSALSSDLYEPPRTGADLALGPPAPGARAAAMRTPILDFAAAAESPVARGIEALTRQTLPPAARPMQEVGRPIERGVLKAASSLTSPESLGVLLAGYGLSGIAPTLTKIGFGLLGGVISKQLYDRAIQRAEAGDRDGAIEDFAQAAAFAIPTAAGAVGLVGGAVRSRIPLRGEYLPPEGPSSVARPEPPPLEAETVEQRALPPNRAIGPLTMQGVREAGETAMRASPIPPPPDVEPPPPNFIMGDEIAAQRKADYGGSLEDLRVPERRRGAGKPLTVPPDLARRLDETMGFTPRADEAAPPAPPPGFSLDHPAAAELAPEPAPEPGPPGGVERRQDVVTRQRFRELPDEEKERLYFTSEKTGLPNYRAFEDARSSPVIAQSYPHVGFFDLDDFKQLNAKLTEAGVDQEVLPAVGQIFREAEATEPVGTIQVFHRGGDEFLAHAKTQAALDRIQARADAALRASAFNFTTPEGERLAGTPSGVSLGRGHDETSANRDLFRAKEERRQAGLRSGIRPEESAAVANPPGEPVRGSDLAGRPEDFAGRNDRVPGPPAAPGPPELTSFDRARLSPEQKDRIRAAFGEYGRVHEAALPEDILGVLKVRRRLQDLLRDIDVGSIKTLGISRSRKIFKEANGQGSTMEVEGVKSNLPKELQPSRTSREGLTSREEMADALTRMLYPGRDRNGRIDKLTERQADWVGRAVKWAAMQHTEFRGQDEFEEMLRDSGVTLRDTTAPERREQPANAPLPRELARTGNRREFPDRRLKLPPEDLYAPHEQEGDTSFDFGDEEGGLKVREPRYVYGDEREPDLEHEEDREPDPGEETGVEEQLAVGYANLLRGDPYRSREDILAGMRDVLETAGFRPETEMGPGRMREGITDQEILAAARDAYQSRERVRGAMKRTPAGEADRAFRQMRTKLRERGLVREPRGAYLDKSGTYHLNPLPPTPRSRAIESPGFADRKIGDRWTDERGNRIEKVSENDARVLDYGPGEIERYGPKDDPNFVREREYDLPDGNRTTGPDGKLPLTEGEKEALDSLRAGSAAPRDPALRRRGPVSARTLGSLLADKLERGRTVDLRGQKVNSPADLAALAQVYRNPRFETTRYFYVRDGEILAHHGVTSRLPGMSHALREESLGQEALRMRREMHELGADGWYMLHNHPTGEPRPSSDDLTTTEHLAQAVSGFRGHVVIDDNEYAVINRHGPGPSMSFEVLPIENEGMPEPAAPHPLLGAEFRRPEDVARIGEQLKGQEGYVTLFYGSGRGHVRAIQEIPEQDFLDTRAITRHVRRNAVAFGGSRVVAYSPSRVEPGPREALADLVQRRVLVDHVEGTEPLSAMSRARHLHPNQELGFSEDEVPKYVVKERASDYGTDPEAMRRDADALEKLAARGIQPERYRARAAELRRQADELAGPAASPGPAGVEPPEPPKPPHPAAAAAAPPPGQPPSRYAPATHVRAHQAAEFYRTGVSQVPPEPPDTGRIPEDRTPAARAFFQGLRERYAHVGREFGQGVQDGLIGLITRRRLVDGLSRRFEIEAVGKNKADADEILRGIVGVGYHHRAEQLRAEGKEPGGIPDVGAEHAARVKQDPKIAHGIDVWMKKVEPSLKAIRRRLGLPVDTWGDAFQINLRPVRKEVPELVGLFNPGTAKTMKEMFEEAFGAGEYVTDPREVLKGIMRSHYRMLALKEWGDALRKSGVTFEPEETLTNLDGQRTVKIGKTIYPVQPVLLPNGEGGMEPKYVPRKLIDLAKATNSSPLNDSSAWDRMMDLGTTTQLAVGADVAPHERRMLAALSAYLGQSGHSLADGVPWLGSRTDALAMIRKMHDSPIGDAMQFLAERNGFDRGTGYRIAEDRSKSKLAHVAGFGHDLLFNERYGADVLMRRVAAYAYLGARLGPEPVRQMESDLASGRITPAEAAMEIQERLGPAQALQMARDVNNTMGYNNHLLRTEFLNKVQRGFPYIGSQSGMVPGEIRRTLTLNVSVPKIAHAAREGRRGQAALMALGSLMSGPLGTMIALQVANMLFAKARGEEPKSTFENRAPHRLDLRLLGKWYLSNFDPGLTRATRLLGLRVGLKHRSVEAGLKDIPREALDEVLGSLAPLLRLMVSAGTAFTKYGARVPYITERGEALRAPKGWWWPLGMGRELIRNVAGDRRDTKAESLGKTAAAAAGYQLSNR